MTRRGMAGQGAVGLGKARPGKAWQGGAGQGEAWRGSELMPIITNAQPGLVVVSFWDGATIDRRIIVAWRIEDGDVPEPIVCDGLSEVWCIEQHLGDTVEYVFPEDRAFDTFLEATEYAMERWRIIRTAQRQRAERLREQNDKRDA